jgi:hypothetical protein
VSQRIDFVRSSLPSSEQLILETVEETINGVVLRVRAKHLPGFEYNKTALNLIFRDLSAAQTCSPTVTTNCLPLPFDGFKLQIMPWPAFQDMTDHELQAVYEYLSAVPCVAGPPDPSNVLHNDCN